MSEELGAPNDPSSCSSRGSLIWYNSVSRTPSHTETSQGVLQVGDHVESNQMPIKMSSGVGRWLLPRSTPAPGSSAAHLPSLPCTSVPRHGLPTPSTSGWSLFLQHTRHTGWDGTGHPSSSQTQLSRTMVPTQPSRTTLPQSHLSQKGMDVDARQHLSSQVRARAGVSLHTLSTTPGLSLSLSWRLLHPHLGQILSEGVHTYSLDPGEGLGTGLSLVSSPEPAGWGSAPKRWLRSPPCRGRPPGRRLSPPRRQRGRRQEGTGGK